MKRNSKEWKEKRAEFLKGKTCAWCGSSKHLRVHNPQAASSSPSRIRSEIYGIAYEQFREIYRQKYQKFEVILTGKHRHKSHPNWHRTSTVHKIEPDHAGLEEQYREVMVEDTQEGNFKKLYNEWLEENRVKELIEEEIEKAQEEYESLENALVLCRRCHFAILRGMELCPVCKKKYKSVRYDTCFDCLPEEKKGEILEKKR
ncbi:hypothetical protein FTO70_02620 [Methanosarcina sp. KYL-1]|uniref:hypothetical protein n=1 Tax=Methanosarcina sp. KYL-1 TaxID=2602068 RepID=UPI0021016FB0|nr:hypothetical protein [Methanosarcina sp. KYL-1]MCQ1534601.1 hypothetical protein [Methanosarcina sp. KYL-1]